MPLHNAGDYKVSYEVHEASAPQNLLFLHGNIASNRWWYPALAEIEKTFAATAQPLNGKMVLAELRGCGKSPALPADYVMTCDDLVNDFIALTEALGLQDVTIVGHSTGGLISCLLMARRPDLFKGALLIDPAGPKGISFPDDLYEKYDMMKNDRAIAAQVIGMTIYQNDSESEFFKTVIVDDTVQGLQNAGIQIVRAIRDIDVAAEVARVEQPVTIFYGAHDWVLEKAHATDLQALMKNSELVLLPDNGHCMNMESPARLAQELAKFLTQHAGTYASQQSLVAAPARDASHNAIPGAV